MLFFRFLCRVEIDSMIQSNIFSERIQTKHFLHESVIDQVREIVEVVKMECMYENDSCHDCPNKEECETEV